MQTFRRFWVTMPVALLIAVLLLPASASAHERRTIGNGKYDVVVGWDVEPALQGQKNAASIRISKAGTSPAEAVTGAEKTLKIQVRQGATTREFPLRAVFGQQGYYVADIIPTRTGDYQFAFVGQIGDDQVNEKFDSADGKFDGIKPTTDMQFPVAQPDPAQATAAAQSAQAEAQSARTLGMAGIAVGVLGVLAGAAAWATRPRSTARLSRPVEQA
jgi:hypothetical protein